MTPQQANEAPSHKQRAREIIEQLTKLDNSKKPGGGVHGQVIGCEPYIIRTTGDGLQCLWEAGVLLDELLDPFDRRAPAPTEPAVDRGLEAAAALVERKAAAYDAECGNTDPDTGTREYPGEGASWVMEMEELAEEIRALATPASPAVPAPAPLAPRRSMSMFATLEDYRAAQASQPASAEELQQSEHIPPFAEPASLLNAGEMAAFQRFHECALDGEGYDVPKEMMQRLAGIGVVRRGGGAFYEHTDYGLAVLDGSHQVGIGEVVNRFLGWRLPDTFSPDCGISFTPLGHPSGWPIGTNLLNADEARAMFEYVLAGRFRAPGGNTASTPEAVNLLVEEAKRVMGQPGSAYA